ncbi:hypothetical protein ACFRIC_00910 [Streptomyces sp. NPDC056738]|uniref:hypothetical protein n=1 Tax=Streptomyces sp. NPDC056738 TaxID=3345933 RepID=UPI0036961B4A
MGTPPSAVISRAATVRRIDALFRAMETDFLLREQFITGPSQILTDYLAGPTVPEEEAALTDRLIYSVFASPKLLQWFEEYVHRHRDEVPTGGQFLADFCEATVSSGSRDVVATLLHGCSAEAGIYGLTEDLLHYFVNLHVAQTIAEERDGRQDEEPAADQENVGIQARGTTPFVTNITWTTYVHVQQEDSAQAFSARFVPSYAAVTLNGLARYAVELQARDVFRLG